MKTNVLLKKLGVAGAVCGLLVSVANATIVYSTTTGSGNLTAGPYVLGMDFVVNTGGYVNKIGLFDNGGDGFSGAMNVAIYKVSDGSIVAGTQTGFSSGSAGTLVGNSRFKDLSSAVYLAPGTYSVVVTNLATGLDPAYFYNGSPTPATSFNNLGGALTFVSGGRFVSGSSLIFPNSLIGGPAAAPTFGAGTFDFTPVPEATEFAMAGMGLLAVIYIGRCAVLRRKLAA